MNKLCQAGLVVLAVGALSACSDDQSTDASAGAEVVAQDGDTTTVAGATTEEPEPLVVDASGSEAEQFTDGDGDTTVEPGDTTGSTTLATEDGMNGGSTGGPTTTAPPWVSDGGEPAEVVDIQTFYNETLLTVQSNDGAAAVALSAPTTLRWADGVLGHTLDADADALLNDVPMSTATTVVVLRALIPTADLLALQNGEDLVEVAVDSGLIGALLSAASGQGTTAQGELVVNGDEAFNVVDGVQTLRFERVNGAWTFDLSHSLITTFDINGGTQPSDRQQALAFFASLGEKTWDDVNAPLR
jgi:hypothetical protein